MKNGDEGEGSMKAYFQFSNLCHWIVGGAIAENRERWKGPRPGRS